MAKKKSSKSKVDVMLILSTVAGVMAGAKANNMAMAMEKIPENGKKFVPVVVAGAGYGLMHVKDPHVHAFGLGVLSAGAVKTVGVFVPKLGIGDTTSVSDYMIEGGRAGNYALNGLNEGKGTEALADARNVTGAPGYSLSGQSHDDEINSDLCG